MGSNNNNVKQVVDEEFNKKLDLAYKYWELNHEMAKTQYELRLIKTYTIGTVVGLLTGITTKIVLNHIKKH